MRTSGISAGSDDGTGWPAVLGWAAFLASSWTWCIGLFLPVLLVRDLGVAGWLVFAVPNVIGAAAMGWVLRSRDASRRLAERHRFACIVFSLVTIWFHVFFVSWLLHRLLGVSGPVMAGAGAGAFWVLGRQRGGRDLVAGAAVLGLSLLLLDWTMFWRPEVMARAVPRLPAAQALYLLPVCIFGFALCPYLDLTFHRARQGLDHGSARMAFSIGFGVLFLLMIVLSLRYARWLAPLVDGHGVGRLPRLAAVAIGVHMALQIGFTVAVHLRAVGGAAAPGWPRAAAGMALAASLALVPLGMMRERWLGMDSGELVYRCFMGFYGLLFPAYVWLFMRPRGAAVPVRGVNLATFGIAVAAAAPFFWIGFVLNRLVWLLPGLALTLLVRPFMNRGWHPAPGRVHRADRTAP